MIRYVRSARTIHGKGGESIKWANNVADYINAQNDKIQITVFSSRFGSMNYIYWIADVEDLASLEQWQKQIAEDAGYRELRRQAVNLFVQDSVKDIVLSTVT